MIQEIIKVYCYSDYNVLLRGTVKVVHIFKWSAVNNLLWKMPQYIHHLEYFASKQWTTLSWSTNYKITFAKIIFDIVAGVSMNLKQDGTHGLPVWGWIICTKCFQVMFPTEESTFP